MNLGNKKLTMCRLSKLGACSEARSQFRKEAVRDMNTIFKRLSGHELNRLDWANWLVVRLMTHEQQIRHAIFAAEQVIEIFEKQYTGDKRPRQAIEAARKYLESPSGNNRDAAAYAASDAAIKIRIINHGLKMLGIVEMEA